MATVRSAQAVLRFVGMHHAQQIESENQIGIGGVHLRGRFDGLLAQQQMRNHRATFLRRSGLIERGDGQAVNPGRGGEQRVDRHHAGSTDSRSDDAITIAGLHHLPRQRHIGRRKLGKRFLLQAGTRLDLHRDKRRAVAQRAGVVLIARRLMDADLLTELGHAPASGSCNWPA